ncbi:unnamed protein product [Absidia cylindrospora]
MALDGNINGPTCFHILYTGHGSPPTKSKVRQELAQTMSTYFTTIQQHHQRRIWRQQQQQQNSTKSLPQQRFNVVTSETLDTDTYEDNGLALWETDATWTLPSMSIILPLSAGDISDHDYSDGGDDGSLFAHYLPQTLYSDLLPQLEADNRKNMMNPPIDLVIYFCNQQRGPLEQDFAALSKLQLPVLPLIIDSSPSSQPAMPIPAPSTSDPDYPPSLSSSFSSSSSQLVTIQAKPLTNASPSPPSTQQQQQQHLSSWISLRKAIATYLQKYHIHCVNITEIHPEVPGFITNASNHCCPYGNPPSMCHIMSADEIMHVDQFTSLDTRVTYKLMNNVRKYNEKWNQVKQHNQQRRRQWYRFLPHGFTGCRWRWVLLSLMMFGLMALGVLQWMHMLTWTGSDEERNSTWGAPLTSSQNAFDGNKVVVVMMEEEEVEVKVEKKEKDHCPLSELPHMMMASGYEYPDADMYHHFTLKITANSFDMDMDMDMDMDDADERGEDHRSGTARKGARQVPVMNQAQLVWDQGGVWTLTKTDWTAHVPSPCKMNWDTDMNLTLWIDMNGGGHWQRTTHQFTLAWAPCNQHQQQHRQERLHQRQFEHTYYPHDGVTSSEFESDEEVDGSTSYFALTPYQHDVLREWLLQLKTWTENRIHSLVTEAKKLWTLKDSLYVYLMQ